MKKAFKSIGTDVIIHNTVIFKQPQLVELKNHILINAFTYCSTQLKVGNYVEIAPHSCIIGGKDSLLILNDFSFIAAGSNIICGSEDYTGVGFVGATIPKKYRKVILSTITFKKFSGCGVNCCIMPGVTLAEGSVLGANSLLLKDTEEWGIYVGSPAKKIGIRNKENIIKYANKL